MFEDIFKRKKQNPEKLQNYGFLDLDGKMSYAQPAGIGRNPDARRLLLKKLRIAVDMVSTTIYNTTIDTVSTTFTWKRGRSGYV